MCKVLAPSCCVAQGASEVLCGHLEEWDGREQDQERANICIHVADSRFMEKLTQYCKAIIFQFLKNF